jgi:hypothetical protein
MVLAIADDAYHAGEGTDVAVVVEVYACTRCHMQYDNQDFRNQDSRNQDGSKLNSLGSQHGYLIEQEGDVRMNSKHVGGGK